MEKESLRKFILRAELIGLMILAACSEPMLHSPKLILSSHAAAASDSLGKRYFSEGNEMWFCSRNQPDANVLAIWTRREGRLSLVFRRWKYGTAGSVLNFSQFEGALFEFDKRLWVHDGSANDPNDSYEDYIIFDQELWGKGEECFQVIT